MTTDPKLAGCTAQQNVIGDWTYNALSLSEIYTEKKTGTIHASSYKEYPLPPHYIEYITHFFVNRHSYEVYRYKEYLYKKSK